MTWYGYDSQIALDQSTEQIARNAAGHVYATTDTTFSTPLTVTDLAGVVRSEIIANGLGLIEEFRVEDHKLVVWKSGDFKTQLASISGIIADAEEARASAAQALQDLQDYIAQNPALPAGRTPGTILGTLTDNSLGWVSPTTGGGSGILNAPTVWPSTFPPAAHSEAVGQLRKSEGGAALLQAVLDFLTADTAKKARDAIGAVAASELSIPIPGPLATNFMPGNRTFSANEIGLGVAIPGLSATTNLLAAVTELAARPTGGGTGTLPFVYRNETTGVYGTRPNLPAGVYAWWIGSVEPPQGGLYMLPGDFYFAPEDVA